MAERLTPSHLAQANLAPLLAGLSLPRYARAQLRPAILHLGIGAFFRAHGALYTEDVLNERGGDWGIRGVSLQRPDQRDRLAPQGGCYTALEAAPECERARIVGNLLDVQVAPENPGAVLAALAGPDTRIVSLTVTEKGYCHDPATGRLRADHPDIRHDLDHPDAPRSTVGFLAAGLRRRRAGGLAPYTVLCCDNLPGNGALLAGLVRDFAALTDDALAGWIEATVPFPSTMVDRIVPALAEADLAAALRLTGLEDRAPVRHEPFRQWVIEDRFVAGDRPDWGSVGAQFVGDVAPFEHMKLRLLNGAHSALAYLGYLAGHENVADAVGDPALSAYLSRFWAEVRAVVPPPPGQDIEAYTRALAQRFANPAIRHRTWQIAMDGSQKLPQRLLSSIRDRLARGLPIPALALAVAAWARYVGGTDERGAPIDVRDPLARPLRQDMDAAGIEPAARIGALLRTEAVFGSDLAGQPAFVDAVTEVYTRLLKHGARAAAQG